MVPTYQFCLRNNLLSYKQRKIGRKGRGFIASNLMIKISLLDCKQLKGSDQVPFILMFFQYVVPHKYMPSNFFFRVTSLHLDLFTPQPWGLQERR